jgi:membrane fusion protein (multidrug efflux system)
MKQRVALLFALPLIAACGPSGPGGKSDAPKSGPGAGGMPPAEVEVIVATTGSSTLTQELPGRLQAYRTAQVRARVEGIVEKRLFTEGADVREGAPLFRIDARNYQAAFDAATADVAVARLTLERYRPLLDLKAVSRHEFDLAEARLKQAEAVQTRTRIDLENTTVPAPIAGRIGRTLVSEGALVGRGESTPLATIEQIDPIYANFTQPGADLLRLKQAIRGGKLKEAERAKVELILEDGSVYPHPGKLLFADLAVDPATGSVALRALFPNPRQDLLPGGFARIRFSEAIAEQVIRVPQRAVQAGPQGQFVTVVNAEGKAAPLPVKTGGMSGSDFIISSGLQGGEQVIVNGLQKARPGSPVKAVPVNSAVTPAPPATPAQSGTPVGEKK